MDKIPVCVAYDINGTITQRFPVGHALAVAKPVYEYLPGWQTDISGCRSFSQLPPAAKDYVKYIEKATGSRIRYVSVGAGREEYFEM